jgi:hypothetical protein
MANPIFTSRASSVYCKHITIVKDTSRLISEWGHNLEHYSKVIKYAPRGTIYTYMWHLWLPFMIVICLKYWPKEYKRHRKVLPCLHAGKEFAVTNALAYFAAASVTEEERFVTSVPARPHHGRSRLQHPVSCKYFWPGPSDIKQWNSALL